MGGAPGSRSTDRLECAGNTRAVLLLPQLYTYRIRERRSDASAGGRGHPPLLRLPSCLNGHPESTMVCRPHYFLIRFSSHVSLPPSGEQPSPSCAASGGARGGQRPCVGDRSQGRSARRTGEHPRCHKRGQIHLCFHGDTLDLCRVEIVFLSVFS